MNVFASLLTRLALAILARYEGVQWNPNRSIIPAGYQGARFDADCHSRSELARRMRYFERNNPLVQALAGKFENFVVGSSPQLTPISSKESWNESAKASWDQWCQFCDLSSRQNFGTLLSLVARRWFIEGDVFIVLTNGNDQGGRRPRLQIIEGHLCRTPPEYSEDPTIYDGVRIDQNGRPIEYFFAEEPEPSRFVFPKPRPASEVIHIFEPERPGELRGITFFHSVVNELHDIDDLHVLEMQAAKENASTSDWIETLQGELDPNQVRRNIFSGQATQTAQGAASTEPSRVEYYRQVGGARTRVLLRGDKIHQHAGERPSVTTREYWRLKRELVCAAVEIPYCLIFPDVMQGTVYRGALDMVTSAFRSRHAVIADAERRIFAFWGAWATRNEKALVDPPSDWRNVSVLPPRAPNVDVGRNSAAMLAELKSGATNYDQIYGQLGLHWKTELTKLEKQLAFIASDCPNLYRMMTAPQGQLAPPDTSGAANEPDLFNVPTLPGS